MNKTDFIKALSEKLGYDEEKCTVINSIVEDHFIVGKSHKEKLLADFIEKLGVNQEEADRIYNVVAEIISDGIFGKIKRIFKK